jgi:hypothetical protein
MTTPETRSGPEHRQRQRGTSPPLPAPAAGGEQPTPQSTPGGFDLNIYRGDSYTWEFKLWTDAAKTQPYDLTNENVKSEIRDAPAGTILATMTAAVTLPNIIDLTLPAPQSQYAANGVWDLQLTNSVSGWVSTVVSGKVIVTPDVTDSAAGAPP